jgi:hypothetical protein
MRSFFSHGDNCATERVVLCFDAAFCHHGAQFFRANWLICNAHFLKRLCHRGVDGNLACLCLAQQARASFGSGFCRWFL